jgi:hypothetical protein
MVDVPREHPNLEALLSIPVGLLSALEAQGELRELLEALYGEALECRMLTRRALCATMIGGERVSASHSRISGVRRAGAS